MKIKLGIFFGGKSVEHEISVITMSQAVSSINVDKYDLVPIYIAKDGVMYWGEDLLDLQAFRDMDVLLKRCYKVAVVNDGTGAKVIRVPAPIIGRKIIDTIDIAFPIVHGTNCEDGTLAGFLNTLNIPVVGPDILSSSVGMDKIIMKKVCKESGIPVVDYVSFYSMEYIKDDDAVLKKIAEKLRYPLIVKPGNCGSSVGIRKAKDEVALVDAIEYAMEFSDRIIVEEAVQNLKEINCSVIGNLAETEASVCEEPFFSDDILTYQDKYMGGSSQKGAKGSKGNTKGGFIKGTPIKGQGAKGSVGMQASNKKLPADIPDSKRDEIQALAQETFKVLGCSGVARIDFLMDSKTEKVYVNEINTIPGALSYYLWEATGKTFEEQLDQMVDIALKRQREKDKITYSYDENILAMQPAPGTKGMKGSKSVKR